MLKQKVVRNKLVKTAKLSSQGQITLPKKALQKLGIEPNQLVDLIVTKDSITIKKKTNPFKKFVGVLKGKVDLTSDEFIKIRKEEAKLI